MKRELVMVDVKPSATMESQSGLNQKWPKVYGALAAPEGARTAAIVCHPTSNFLNHYLIDPLAERGVACMGFNTRYGGNDVSLLMERAIQDLGAGVKYLRERGFERVVMIGNSGGASLAALYQSQAENLTITDTVDGRPLDLSPEDLPPADALVLCAAHPGRARTLGDWLDPALIDERDPLSVDPAFDIFSGKFGPPFNPEFLEEFRLAQRQRRARIERWVQGRLRMLRADPDGPQDEAFVIYRTHADPRFLDVTLDANDRAPGSLWGVPHEVNAAANAMGRFTTLTAYLSQWSTASRADGPDRIAETSVPVTLFDYTADQSVFPSSNAAWLEAIGARKSGGAAHVHLVKGGDHYLVGRPDLVAQVADTIAAQFA
ncbi:MAG: alpha/beta hydrolase [Pseudomonadota bacterium]